MNSVVFLMMKPLTVNFFILFVMTLKGGETKNYEFIIQGRKNHEMCSHRLIQILKESDTIVCLDSFSRIFLNSQPEWTAKISTYSEVRKKEMTTRPARTLFDEIVVELNVHRTEVVLKGKVKESLVLEYRNGFSDKDPPVKNTCCVSGCFFVVTGRYSFPFFEVDK